MITIKEEDLKNLLDRVYNDGKAEGYAKGTFDGRQEGMDNALEILKQSVKQWHTPAEPLNKKIKEDKTKWKLKR